MNPARTLLFAFAAALSLSAHAVGRIADVSIFDRAVSRELPVSWHDARAYVVGRPGNEYQVALRNLTGEEILAVISVDGVNVMDGRDASPGQGGYVIAPWGRLSVRGWRKSMDETAAFYFTQLGDSYAARTGRPANVGVIGVALFRAKRPEPPPYAAPMESEHPAPGMKGEMDSARRQRNDQGSAPATVAPPAAPLGTGHGRREDSPIRWVAFERATSEPEETLAIFYDSYRNLVARGILQPSAGPRDPNPFPTAFVPDPPRR